MWSSGAQCTVESHVCLKNVFILYLCLKIIVTVIYWCSILKFRSWAQILIKLYILAHGENTLKVRTQSLTTEWHKCWSGLSVKLKQHGMAQHGAESLNLKSTFAFHFLHNMGTKSQRQKHNSSLPLCHPKAPSAFSLPTSSLCSPCQTLSPQISY